MKLIGLNLQGNVICSTDYMSTTVKYDKNKNIIYYSNSTGYEEWRDYDENNNLIHFKNSNGYEDWATYDNTGKLIHYKNSKGYEKYY